MEAITNNFALGVVAASIIFLIYFTYKTSFNDAIMHDHPIRGWVARALLVGIVLLSWFHVMDVF